MNVNTSLSGNFNLNSFAFNYDDGPPPLWNEKEEKYVEDGDLPPPLGAVSTLPPTPPVRRSARLALNPPSFFEVINRSTQTKSRKPRTIQAKRVIGEISSVSGGSVEPKASSAKRGRFQGRQQEAITPSSSGSPTVRRSARLASSSQPSYRLASTGYREKRGIGEISSSLGHAESTSTSTKNGKKSERQHGYQSYNMRLNALQQLFSNTVDPSDPGVFDASEYQKLVVEPSRLGPLFQLTRIEKVRHLVRKNGHKELLDQDILIFKINQEFFKYLYKNNCIGTYKVSKAEDQEGGCFLFGNIDIVNCNRYWGRLSPFPFYYPSVRTQSMDPSPERKYYHPMPNSFLKSERIKKLRAQKKFDEITKVLLDVYSITHRVFNERFTTIRPDGTTAIRSISMDEAKQFQKFLIEDRETAIREVCGKR